MTPFDPDALKTGRGTWFNSRLPRLLTPIQIELETGPEGCVLRLDPMKPTTALAVLAEFGDAVGLRTGPGDLVTVTCDDPDEALVFVAERLRRYVATALGVEPREVRRPVAGLVDRLLACSGYLRIRPIETEMHSTAIDIGIGLNPEAIGPAETSLIYDLCSGTWHGD